MGHLLHRFATILESLSRPSVIRCVRARLMAYVGVASSARRIPGCAQLVLPPRRTVSNSTYIARSIAIRVS
jgi:hypothetical protein